MNDEIKTLVNQAKHGEHEAFTKLYEKHCQAMYYYALKLCQNNQADAQEMVQEAFVSAFEHLDQLQKPEYFPLWLKKIVHSKCIRMFYKTREVSFDPDMMQQQAIMEQRVERIPHESINNITDQQIIRLLMKDLTEKQEQVLDYFYFQEYSINEIAQALNLSKGTVKSRIFEARRALKKRVDEFEAQEHRTISFHLHPVIPSLCYLLAYRLSNTKIFQSNLMVKSAAIAATASCSVLTIGSAIVTYDTVNEPSQSAYVSIPSKEQGSQQLQSVEFPVLQYGDKEITTARAAYYTIMKIAPDQASLNALSKQEKDALQPLIQAVKESDTRYQLY